MDSGQIDQVLSGRDRSLRARLLRGVTAAAEPFYASAMRLRNGGYERGWLASHALGKPTISVGNITTGGTGKTPVVLWLADRLRQAGRHPAVLMRGYRPTAAGISDEQHLLDRELNPPGEQRAVIPVIANPDRVAGAQQALSQQPAADVFLLDDGFQHRRVRRDFDLVLISATQPFGYGHVLPRGLLREPLSGLRRADAILLTRCTAIAPPQLEQIEQTVRRHNPDVPLLRCDHVQSGLRQARTGELLPMSVLRDEPFFAFCGLADPQSFFRGLQTEQAKCVGQQAFPDHHDYTPADLQQLQDAALRGGASRLVTSEKDWAKLATLPDAEGVQIYTVCLRLQFQGEDEQCLMNQVMEKLNATRR